MRIQKQNKNGIISEFLVRIMSILSLIAIFIVFAFIVQLSECGCSDSEAIETLSYESDKALFLDTAVDNMLNSNITISFKGNIIDEGFSMSPKLSKSFVNMIDEDIINTLEVEDTPEQSITLPLWKAIAIYADYDKSVFKDHKDFKEQFKKTITDYITTALSKIEDTATWKGYVVIDKKVIIILPVINKNLKSPSSDEMVTFPSDYNAIYKTRTIPRLSVSDSISSLELIVQFKK